MIIIHHLGISQSDRVVWLMEELGLPYELRWYNRGKDFLAPPEYRALHPAGTAPIIEDDNLVLAESTAIVEYISQRYGEGKLSVPVESPSYPHYLYWMQFNNNLQAALFIKLATQGQSAEGNSLLTTTMRRIDGYYDALENRLGEAEYLGGNEFSCADIMSVFNLTSLAPMGGRKIDESMPNTQKYLEKILARPAYQKAMEIAGPRAKPK